MNGWTRARTQPSQCISLVPSPDKCGLCQEGHPAKIFAKSNTRLINDRSGSRLRMTVLSVVGQQGAGGNCACVGQRQRRRIVVTGWMTWREIKGSAERRRRRRRLYQNTVGLSLPCNCYLCSHC